MRIGYARLEFKERYLSGKVKMLAMPVQRAFKPREVGDTVQERYCWGKEGSGPSSKVMVLRLKPASGSLGRLVKTDHWVSPPTDPAQSF